MKRLGWSYFSMLVFVMAGCGSFDEQNQYHIEVVRGMETSVFPAVVKLNMGNKLCSGTYISHNVVITAAHCLMNTDRISINGVFEVERSINPHYKHTILDGNVQIHKNDIAFLKFPSNSAPSIMEISNQSRPQINSLVSIVGYGANIKNSNIGIGVKRIGKNNVFLLPDFLKVADMNDGALTAPGDSGGALIQDNKLIGVVSGTSNGSDSRFVDLALPENKEYLKNIKLKWSIN